MIKRFLAWLVYSSADPSKLALTVKGLGSLAVVQVVLGNLLPAIGVHIALDFNSLGDVVYSVLNIVSAVMALMGAVRKIANTIVAP